MITTILRTIDDKIEDLFVLVAFAEAGDLFAAHPRHLRALTDLFVKVAFAEAGCEYEEEAEEIEETETPVYCVLGETAGGLCV